MKNRTVLALIIGIMALVGLGVFFSRVAGPSNGSTQKPVLAATFTPLTLITREIAGDDFDIINILPPGASPHTFEPTPDLVIKLQKAKTLFMIGHGIDDWATVLANNIPDVRLVTVDKGIALKSPKDVTTFGTDDDEHASGSLDPHYWLVPANGILMAENIASDLEALAPEKKAGIEQRLRLFTDKMTTLDSRITQLFTDKTNRKILTHHNAWRYFADAYGLEIVATIEPSPGQTLTATEMAGLQDIVKKDKIRTLFIEPELSQMSVASLSKDLNLEIKTLDPEGGLGAKDYADMLWRNAQTIAQSL
ncbi:MAG: metal ABC transporter substrate-binding protein [Patescibacteria group bacterium]